jgi:hypothetical protein
MSRWWRAYDRALDDPKLQQLGPGLFQCWFNLMCLASQHDGALPEVPDIAFRLRLTVLRATKLIRELVRRRLIDDENGVLRPHDWDEWQYKSDSSAERTRRYRARKHNKNNKTLKNVTSRDGHRDGTDTDTDTDTDTEAESSSQIVFQSGCIRLNRRDFDQWQAAFTQLDLKAELLSLSEWASKQGKNWFHAVSAALAKRNREAKLALEKAKNPKILTPDESYYGVGRTAGII